MQNSPLSFTGREDHTDELFFAGGCLWGVQEFIRYLPGVVFTEAGRANGTTNSTKTAYDGYAECVRIIFDPAKVTVVQLDKIVPGRSLA